MRSATTPKKKKKYRQNSQRQVKRITDYSGPGVKIMSMSFHWSLSFAPPGTCVTLCHCNYTKAMTCASNMTIFYNITLLWRNTSKSRRHDIGGNVSVSAERWISELVTVIVNSSRAFFSLLASETINSEVHNISFLQHRQNIPSPSQWCCLTLFLQW